MKNRVLLFLTGFMTGIAILVFVIIMVLPRQMFMVYESKSNFDQTVEMLAKSAAEKKWSIPHQYDLQATMKKHGFEVEPVKIFSLCNPEHAYEILKNNEVRLASAIMPCRIAVYEKDGKTFVSMLNSGLFSKFMGAKIKEVMGTVSEENKQILAPIIK